MTFTIKQAFDLAFTVRPKWIDGAGRETNIYNRNHTLRILGEDLPVTEVKPSTFAKLAAELRAEGKAAGTQNRVCACLRTALMEAHLEGHLDHVPSYRQQKEPPARREYYTMEQFRTMLAFCPTIEDGELLQRSLLFFYLTGCRKSELLNLKWLGRDEVGNLWECVNFETNKIAFLDTKNGDHHIIEIHPELLPIMQKMYEERVDEDSVFAWPSRDVLNRRMKKLLKKAGIDVGEDGQAKRYIHAIRHTTATHLVEAGVPIRSIQGLLNHKQISTTTAYAKVNEKAKADAISNLASPL